MRRLRFILSIIFLFSAFSGCTSVQNEPVKTLAPPERHYIGYSHPFSEEDGAYSFVGETSKRDMDLYNAVFSSFDEAEWTTLTEGLSHYEQYLSPDNEVTTPCAISGSDHFKGSDVINPAVEREILLDLDLAFIKITISDYEVALFIFDIQEDGFFAPMRVYVIENRKISNACMK